MQMLIYIVAFIIFFLVNLVLVIIRSNVKDAHDEALGAKANIKDVRKAQAGGFRELAVKKKFENYVKKKSKPTKYEVTEQMILQSGYKISVGELKIFCVGTGIILFLLATLGLGNILLGAMFFFFGYLVPSQVIHFVANRRVIAMEKQVGSFIQLVTERYKTHGDFQRAVQETAPDFKDRQPLYGELQKTILDFQLGIPTTDAISELGKRTGNKFLKRLSDYYEIASALGTQDARERIVGQAYKQFYDDYKMKATLKEQIRGPRNEAYLMVAFIPLVVGYQMYSSPDYLTFMLNDSMGKIGCVGITAVIVLSMIFINKKIGAPLN